MARLKKRLCILAGIAAVLAFSLGAEEGMFLPNALPLKALKNRYNFVPSERWLEIAQRAVVRFPNGTGSFVSAEGLVMTNHHIGVDWAARLSTAKNDLVQNGFMARKRSEEKRCDGLTLITLQTITDVTDRAENGKPSALNVIESEESKRAGLKCEAVSLWNGAKFHLYCYKRYTDVRLAFIPENAVAQFGGDPDNFEYPRYNLDFALFRAYENGKPAHTPAHFGWRTGVLAENELVFTSGHPGRTDRWHPVSTYKYYRDAAYPGVLDLLRRYEIALQQFSVRSRENERIAKEELFSIQNSRKAYIGKSRKIQDPAFLAEKMREEAEIRAQLTARTDLAARYGSAWDEIAAANEKSASAYREWRLFGAGNAFWSKYFETARTITQIVEERNKPEANRLPGYTDTALPSLIEEALAPEPIYPALEEAMLGESLTYLTDVLGGDHVWVETILAGKTPRDRARELVANCALGNLEYRKQLIEGGIGEVRKSPDPMIQFVRLVDSEIRRWQKFAAERGMERKKGYAKLYEAMHELGASSAYPDATFTLRVSVGVTKGYEENGISIPFATDFAGLYRRASERGSREPWNLPKRWLSAKKRVNHKTPLNIVSTNDITGGNSGSPLFDREGNVVGLIFDGNLKSLGNDLMYAEMQERAISVSAQGIVEALQKVYGAKNIVNELGK